MSKGEFQVEDTESSDLILIIQVSLDVTDGFTVWAHELGVILHNERPNALIMPGMRAAGHKNGLAGLYWTQADDTRRKILVFLR